MKKIVALLGLTLAFTALLSACSTGNKSGTASSGATDTAAAYHKMTAEEAKQRIDQGNVTIVDVRRAEEYQEKHIPGAILLPLDTIQDQMPSALPDKDAVLLVYCRTGVRSKQASERLIKLGYTNVYDFGGIVDWPYETESGAANEQ